MTVEIAIMNLEAVALAADSALTASTGDNQKIFSSQNKLFALSDVAPVGVLVYGNASFMSIPWETLVKEYRRRRAGQTLDRLTDYAADFCEFLAHDVLSYVSHEHQIDYAESLAYSIFAEIDRAIDQGVTEQLMRNAAIPGDRPLEIDEVNDLFDQLTVEVVDDYYRRAMATPLVDGAPADLGAKLDEELGDRVKQAREQVFDRRLRRGVPQKLSRIAFKSITGLFDDVTGQPGSGPATGIVIAGFGDQDVFPALAELHVEGTVQDILKMRHEGEDVLRPNHPATIVPFAQADMIYQFMQGIDPGYHDYMRQSVVSHLGSYTDRILENLDRYSADDREEIAKRLGNVHPEIAESFVRSVDDIGDTFAQSIMDVVAMLPKDQLAEMAEALVSLTSLKRRVSLQEETVGGPTDVALITKGDGLIWVKRKHYFPAELNPAYFARKYGREKHGTSTSNEDR